MSISLSTAARNAAVDAIVDLIDGGGSAGYIEIRTGSKPASVATGATGTLLATVSLADPAFGSSASGTAAATDPAAINAVADGTAGWFRVYDNDATDNAIMDGTVTATGGGGDMTLATVSIATGLSVDITSFTVTMPAG